MAHMVESMAYAGETPWHGLGFQVSNNLTPEEMMKAAKLDWTVSKKPLFYMNDAGELCDTTQNALTRDSDGTILSYVPESWKPLQNVDAFRFFNQFVEAGDMEMDTAGSLRDGQMVWGLAKVKDQFDLKFGRKVDTVESYLLFSNPHQFGKTITVDFTPIRVVCNNTLTLALSKASAQMVKFNHKNYFDAEAAKKLLMASTTEMAKYHERAEFLASKPAKADDVKEFFKQIFPSTSRLSETKDEPSRNAKLALDAIETQPGADLGIGTWWAPFNAVTYLVDHKLGRTQETRLANSWYGPTKDTKLKALHLALDFAKAA